MAFLEYRPTRTLYQYCTPDAFRGIVRSKGLWFTDLYGANDPREIRLGHKKFITAINHVAECETNLSKKNYLYMLADKLMAYTQNARAYSACFSLARDELPMWGTYGAQHGGISVGFRPTALFGIPARIQLVKYVDEDSDEDFRNLVLQNLREIDMHYPPNNIHNTLSPVVGAFTLMTGQKHKSWGYEREVRMIHAQRILAPVPGEHDVFSLTGHLPDGQLVKWKKPFGRTGLEGPKYYLEFPFGKFRNGIPHPTRAIAEVIVGPKCALTTDDIKSELTANGFKDFSVVKSDCQIR